MPLFPLAGYRNSTCSLKSPIRLRRHEVRAAPGVRQHTVHDAPADSGSAPGYVVHPVRSFPLNRTTGAPHAGVARTSAGARDPVNG